GTPIRGWSSLVCLVLLATGLILLMLGMIGEYVWRALDASRNRPPYIIDEVHGTADEDKKS
ncbi:MAG: glycosyltransferase, partial [Lachnospiraceae bacterium]|nr:glycosyltransferase [Lachnospiraceae bacterium]